MQKFRAHRLLLPLPPRPLLHLQFTEQRCVNAGRGRGKRSGCMGKMRERWKKSQAATFLAAAERCGVGLVFFFPFFLTPVDGQRWYMRRELGRGPGKEGRSEGSGNRGWKLSHGFWAPFKSCWVRSLARAERPRETFSPAFQPRENHIHSVSGGRGKGMGAASNSA